MLEWLVDVLLPYLLTHGGGPNGKHALMLWDPFKAHLTKLVRKWLKENRVDMAVMPASCTRKFQMIDIVVRAALKNEVYELWAQWMLQTNDSLGLTAAGNRKHPTLKDVIEWLDTSWNAVSMEGVKKKAKELGMSAESGPAVEGYVPKDSNELCNVEGREVEANDKSSSAFWMWLLKLKRKNYDHAQADLNRCL